MCGGCAFRVECVWSVCTNIYNYISAYVCVRPTMCAKCHNFRLIFVICVGIVLILCWAESTMICTRSGSHSFRIGFKSELIVDYMNVWNIMYGFMLFPCVYNVYTKT